MAAPVLPHVDLHRGDERLRTRVAWLHSRHSFSFGHHYEPDNTHHGVLLVNNEDVIAPGAGFDSHPHRNLEILTWVLEGVLTHEDSMGNTTLVRPGALTRLYAGSGITHSERNASEPDESVRFIQMWVAPDDLRPDPSFEHVDIAAELNDGDLIPVASGMDGYRDHVPLGLSNRHATLHIGRLNPGRTVTLPNAPYLHVYVARGEAEMTGVGPIDEGDAVRITFGPDISVHTDNGAEILVWEMHARLSPGN
ncbi:pirin family protein [Smaragdicoccus niigatensis]|uniref:pirin family protein n=1 Tax=Smaragdicoccus niigatensis TaxID=359359 RepID=UPI0003645466|nr:pirin-like bicupin family protein [Smaragdicoccus niigatensis]